MEALTSRHGGSNQQVVFALHSITAFRAGAHSLLTEEETRAMKHSKVSREDGRAQAGGSSFLFQHTGGLRQEDAKVQRPRRM